jgi:hypothetical protein
MRVLTFLFTVVFANAVLPGQSGLKIIVVAGEDAVNIIQQKTAVAPIVEVRDRNDQPVAGAVVNFAVRGGRATFGGARTIAVTTDVAGRAVATGLTPTASGAVQISASAAFQGQTAAVTITQTNVLTAAQAAAVSSTASSGGAGTGAGTGSGSSGGASAGAGGAGSGGGLSATTIGIVGGAVAGGTVVATQVAGGAGSQSYSGPFSLDWAVGCLVERITATITVDFVASADTPDATVTNGRLEIRNGSGAVVSRPANCGVLGSSSWGMPGAPVTGTLGSLAARAQDTVTSQIGLPFPRSYDFRGTSANGVITGTLSMTWGGNLPQHPLSTGSAPVTLNRAQ